VYPSKKHCTFYLILKISNMAIIGQAIFDLLKYGKLFSRNSFQKPRDGQMSHYGQNKDVFVLRVLRSTFPCKRGQNIKC
jgi:hypothetical protein